MSKLSEETLLVANIFADQTGQRVLDILKKRFKEPEALPDGEDGISIALYLAEQRGAAKVIKYIERQIKQSKEGVT